ncbi:haloacid dehalogenase superfamily, subfamily IA, variant 3 with third motif having DD or ED [Cohaesibacter sp. ES.047]|uniref:HAD-IA family hydrolase n=1 Tax=Cohaesibacter sp. ES.047 TaxID=1798205 RepID=UPI000BB94F9E|nr:HAD-IA family hydrolase [Cohaesibacter sp. ES.047]SNY92527.1 haloacid dehalogenase superfamily, subfamily IA, variant 3 with third motif having DD or ED [Cohaesibacter sp. ES.047]
MQTLELDRIECLIFDLDGTLVDSEVLCLQGYCDTVPDLDWDANYIAAHFRGNKLNYIVEQIEKHIGRSLPETYEETYRARVAELFEQSLQSFPGVEQTILALPHPRCIASAGPLKKMRHSLGLTGLLPLFEPHLFSSYVVGSWKPEPDLFLNAAKAMGFAPEACLVIEDSPVGIEAARRAGMQYLLHCPDGHEPPADYDGPCFSRYADFPLLPK